MRSMWEVCIRKEYMGKIVCKDKKYKGRSLWSIHKGKNIYGNMYEIITFIFKHLVSHE